LREAALGGIGQEIEERVAHRVFYPVGEPAI
jgi:hypothetical protein